ncbi:hypothetical protein BN000_00386 [Mycobacterium europaeum]|uniref:Uncharacterized protein n=1 Tax=Mycobacterium europaeum TaxID=761804 RepID=A0A0U1CZ58_9MYCO|nr:hypothetical protein BN000_00386 [Mycobacterium europaeum]
MGAEVHLVDGVFRADGVVTARSSSPLPAGSAAALIEAL